MCCKRVKREPNPVFDQNTPQPDLPDFFTFFTHYEKSDEVLVPKVILAITGGGRAAHTARKQLLSGIVTSIKYDRGAYKREVIDLIMQILDSRPRVASEEFKAFLREIPIRQKIMLIRCGLNMPHIYGHKRKRKIFSRK